MNTRKITLGFLVLSLLGLLISYWMFQLNLTASATGDMIVQTREGLFYGMSALALVFLLLLFLPNAFPAWKKFAKWFIPLAALLFIFYQGPSSGDYFSPYPEQAFQWVSVLYVVISILIIALKTIRQKNEEAA
mgnify:FL=1